MERAELDGVTLAYEATGVGDAVVCIHGAFIADTFHPLAADPSLTSRYRIIRYHRRGYAASSRGGPATIMQEARDCRALLARLGVDRAHVIGHSYGGCVALQLALDAPEVVHSLVLLEPALMVGESAETYREAMVRSEQRYREAGAVVSVDEALQARCPGYRALLDQMLPGAFDQAVADAETTFAATADFVKWSFDEPKAQLIRQPVLAVLGGESEALWPRFGETHRLLLSWLPNVEGYVLPGATHFLQLENPRDMAVALEGFYARRPLGDVIPRSQ